MKIGVLLQKNMKKTIPNPEHSKATISLGWIVHQKLGPPSVDVRFKIRPPPSAYSSQSSLSEWIKANAIYPTIEVDE